MKKYRKKTLFGCLMIFYISILVKFFQYTILPPKYFYDSKGILSYMNGNYIADKSYNFTAKLFDIINIFKFDELIEWSILLSIIFTTILFFYLIKNNKYNLKQYIFIYSSIALLNIYVFNLSKDMIQFCFFLIIYIIILNKRLKNKTKIFLISIVLIYEAINFRFYYIIMATLIIIVYFLYSKFMGNKEINKSYLINILIFTIIIFFIEVFIVKIISLESYNQIINARSSVNNTRIGSLDAETMINDVFGTNTYYIKFILNYIVNIIRLMLPIELILKGVKYIPFVIYQLFITINLLNLGKKLTNNNILIFATIVSFIMISAIFEPDFGSFIRHESTLTLLLLEMNVINEARKNKKQCVE